ncbi:F0F1 ATP synthase subunit B [Marinobacter nanhaiticus D15-8W]|uniref:ATP synthase subunit b n=1 Tax=Marinobacter nanhaiticus D15-8W TaxID=626887 RepID=N6VYL8_9GAMM|nr:F0F1 ATP synthase subunit B [Marinobacter nanhaiticus]ENO15345.1 F0F1 ATP synthase subunit B [Marinobacter nanhaiticus D15-8W]BES73809.1 F0F1 ATP synthase subunit B [Marinobacter nanhaiticus D15-8W]
MNINLTLIGQAIAFFIFVVFCMKYVWPPIMTALQERQKKIADGLAASDRAARDLELAQEKAAQELREAKQEAASLIEQANKRANQIVEASKDDARKEGQKLIEQAKAEIEQERNQAREALRAEIAAIAIAGAEKILETSVDADKHSEMLNKLAAEL